MDPFSPVRTAVFNNNSIHLWASNGTVFDMHYGTRNAIALHLFNLVHVIWIHVGDETIDIFEERCPHWRELGEKLVSRAGR